MPELNDKSMEDHLKKQLLNTYRTYEKVDENGETNLVVEKKTKISTLVLGDTLPRDIENNEGNIVAKAGTIIDEIYLNKLTNQMNSDSISDLAYVIEEQKE